MWRRFGIHVTEALKHPMRYQSGEGDNGQHQWRTFIRRRINGSFEGMIEPDLIIFFTCLGRFARSG
jgi:hypothetical protein